MSQIARPDATVSQGTWIAEPVTNALWESIDEAVASDTDYIQKTGTGSCEIGLSALVDPLSSIDHIVNYRCRAVGGGQQPEAVTVTWKMGAASIASKITTLDRTGFAADSFTLTGAQADSILDYTDPRLVFDFSQGGPAEMCRVSFAEVRIPDAPLGGTTPWECICQGGLFDGLRFSVDWDTALMVLPVIKVPDVVIYTETSRNATQIFLGPP